MVERSFAPFVHDGFCMDLVSGRGVSRDPTGTQEGAADRLGDPAAGGRGARRGADPLAGHGQGLGGTCTVQPMLEEADPVPCPPRRDSGRREDPRRAGPAGHRLLPMSARAVHRGPGWCAGLSMASYRIGHYEHGNGENLRGWHTGSGMLYWWAKGHGDQYSDSFWAPSTPTDCRARPSPPSGWPTAPARRGVTPARRAAGWAAPPTAGTRRSASTCTASRARWRRSSRGSSSTTPWSAWAPGSPAGRCAGRDHRGQPPDRRAPHPRPEGGLGAPGGPWRLRLPGLLRAPRRPRRRP